MYSRKVWWTGTQNRFGRVDGLSTCTEGNQSKTEK